MPGKKKIEPKGIRISALKIVLLTIAFVVMIGVILYVVDGFFDFDRQPEPGHISGSNPGSEPGTEPGLNNGSDPGSEQGSQDDPDPGSDPEPSPDLLPQPARSLSRVNISSKTPGLSALLDREARSHNCAAVSLVVYDGFTGEFYTYNYGYADRSAKREANPDTKYRVASLSKTIVAISAMKLVEEGKLDLDEDISTYLGYSVRNPNHPNVPITSRMLMQHTSTIYDSNAFNDSLMGRNVRSTENLLSASASFWDRHPGSAHQYSNFGYTVLGAVIEFASGKKLDTYAREVLFDPLDIDAAFLASGLKDTENIAVLYNPGQGHTVNRSVAAQLERGSMGALGQDQNLAQGSLMISAIDYAKILAMLGNGGILLGERILSQESVIEIHTANVDDSEQRYKQGLSTRFTGSGSAEGANTQTATQGPDANMTGDTTDQHIDNLPEDDYVIYRTRAVEEDYKLWQYIYSNGVRKPSDGFFWHTGSAHGIFAQYVYKPGSGTEHGIATANSARGVVVITNGASTDRADNGMIHVCTHLSGTAWLALGFDQ